MMSESIDIPITEHLYVRWLRQNGCRKMAILMFKRPSTGELETIDGGHLTPEDAEILADAAGIGDDDLYSDLLPTDVEDDEQLPQASTESAVEPYCEPCEA